MVKVSREFAGRRVTILGLGVFSGGTSSARYFAAQGADVTVTDLQSDKELSTSIKSLSNWPIRYVLGEHREKDIIDADLVVVNPAIKIENPFVQLAQNRGIPLTTETNLVFQLSNRPIIGITGSNGKTTTTQLIGELLRSVYPTTLVGGNIGKSVLNELNNESKNVALKPKFENLLDSKKSPSYTSGENDPTPLVLELSSFQLQRLSWIQKSPQLAVVTNLSPNHLDWHGSFESYEEAKRYIGLYQNDNNQIVLNADDKQLRMWKDFCPGQVVWFSTERSVKKGCYLHNGQIIYRDKNDEKIVCSSRSFQLPGRHNQANLVAAVTLACLAGIPPPLIQSTVENFKAVEHRLEKVGIINAISYYNDSACTTPTSTVTALRAFENPLILIAGGYDKGIDFDNMAEEINLRARAVILIGSTGDRIEQAIKKNTSYNTEVIRAKTLDEAVYVSSVIAQPKDTVLLSPGCASYDMFVNFEERGNKFKAAVIELDRKSKNNTNHKNQVAED